MKRFILSLAALVAVTLGASAMSYEQARDQALFLTDKMAYELNLTDDQYEAAYEINLDYLMRIDSYDDLYGAYWRQRNLDLSYILLDWQYRAYCDASYFYRPLYWDGGYWHFGIYARYPHRDFFYFGCPNFVVTYHGGHSWYRNGGRSWYYGRRWDGPRDGGPHPGMRARFDNGHYGPGYRYEPGRRTWTGGPQNRTIGPATGGNRSFGGRTNGNRTVSAPTSNGNRSFGNLNRNAQNDSPLRTGNRSFGSATNNGNRTVSAPTSNGNRSFGTPRESSTRTTAGRQASTGSRSFGNRFSSGSSAGSNQAPSRTFSPSSSNRSFGSTSSFGNRSTSSSSAPATRSFGSPSMRSSSTPSRSSGSSFGSHSSGGFGGGHSSGGSSGGGHFGRR